MANPSKAKGDKGERDAVAFLAERVPDLCVEAPMRMYGAGRKNDTGDLRVFPDAVVQVKVYNLAGLGTGMRMAARGATRQQANAHAEGWRAPFAVGMVPIPRARTNGEVRWLAVCETWPGGIPEALIPAGGPLSFTSVTKMLPWLRDDSGPHGYLAYPRRLRIASYGVKQSDDESASPILVAPIEAWLAAYRSARAALKAQGIEITRPDMTPAEAGVSIPGPRTELLPSEHVAPVVDLAAYQRSAS